MQIKWDGRSTSLVQFGCSSCMVSETCLFSSPTFRKLFPEYVEKYNQQREQAQSQASLVPPQDESSPFKSETSNNNRLETAANVENGDRRNNGRQSIPTWMLLLLLSIFGLVMSLPLLEH